MKLFYSFLILATVGCGYFDRKSDEPEEETRNSEDARVPVSSGPSGPIGPGGTDGAAGAQGPAGKNGANGKSGSPGEKGDTGPVGGVLLYDASDRAVGVKFSEEAGGIAHVVLLDHTQVKVDRYSGALVPPSNNIFCMYKSGDCSGSCFVYDRRWLDFLVQDAQGATWVAGRQAPNSGAQAMESYVDGTGSCQMATITTIESFEARPYTPVGIGFPLAAPLYWDIAK